MIALIIGVASLPVGIAVGVWFGREAYRGEIPPIVTAIMAGVLSGSAACGLMMELAKWLRLPS